MRRSGGIVGTSASPTREGWGMTDTPPAMFQRPTDPCQPLPPLRSGGQIARMHTEWARLDTAPGNTASVGDRLRVKARSVGRGSPGAPIATSSPTWCGPWTPSRYAATSSPSASGNSRSSRTTWPGFWGKKSHSYGRPSKGWPTGNPGHPPLRRRERGANTSRGRHAELVVVETGYGALVRRPRRGGGSVTLGRDHGRCADGPRHDGGRRGIRCGRDWWDHDRWLAGTRNGPLGRAVEPVVNVDPGRAGRGRVVLFQAFGDGTAFSIAPTSPQTAGAVRSLPLTLVLRGRSGRDARYARPRKSVGRRQRHMGSRLHRLYPGTRRPPAQLHRVEPPAEAVAGRLLGSTSSIS